MEHNDSSSKSVVRVRRLICVALGGSFALFAVASLFLTSRRCLAIRAIERAGGRILFDYHDISPDVPGPIQISAKSGSVANPIRKFSLHRWVELPVLRDPWVVHLDTARADLLASLAYFRSIRRVRVISPEPGITSKDLLILGQQAELRHLTATIKGGPYDDELLSCVKAWPHLKWLQIVGTDLEMSDAGLAQCINHPSLAVLHIDGEKITDGAIESMQRIPHLRQLWLGEGVSFSEDGILRLLEACPSLRVITSGSPQRCEFSLDRSVTERWTEIEKCAESRCKPVCTRLPKDR